MGLQRRGPCKTPLPLVEGENVIQEQPDQRGLTERYLQESVSFIRKNKENPFFLYLAHMYVHVPLFVPDRFLRESKNGGYGGAVACIDWAMAILEYELKKLGLDQNTLIIFTSDNGSRARDEGGSNGCLRGVKGTSWDGGFRVPCIMKWPGKIPAGSVCKDIVSSIDFLPTIAEACDIEAQNEKPIDGISFLPTIMGEKDKSARDEFYYYAKDALIAIRKGRWKLHVNRGERDSVDWELSPVLELYDLIEDPGESNNVAEENPEIIESLQKRLSEFRKKLGDSYRKIEGTEVREPGRVENAKPLCFYDENHPYMIASYDLADSKAMTG